MKRAWIKFPQKVMFKMRVIRQLTDSIEKQLILNV